MTTQPPTSEKPLQLFYSYAPNTKDDEWRQRLETALATLKRQHYITDWHAQNILSGHETQQQLAQHLIEADIILLLISSDFIASDYCYNTEMQRAIERHNANEARVIPILLRPTDYVGTPFAMLKALPKNEKPLSRWRDKDDALLAVVQGIREVIHEIRSIAPSPSTHNTQTPPKPPPSPQQLWSVPYRRNPFFTGREALITRLHSQLSTSSAGTLTQPQAISGLGGVGKTQVALEYAYQYRQEYHTIFWLRAATADTLRTDMVSLASLLNLPEKDEANQPKVIAAVRHWLTTHNSWLLILDNADDLAMVDTFLPSESYGHILLTTRAQNSSKVADLIPIQEMAQQEGTLLLLRRANIITRDDTLEKATAEQQAHANAIYNELGGLPLALDQAAAYIEEMQCPLLAYLDLYRSHRQDLLQRRSTFGDRHPDSDHPEPVTKTFLLSFQQLEKTHPDAVTLLHPCAFLDPDSIPTEILTHIQGDHFSDAYTLNEALNALRTFSLIRYNPHENLLSIHRLVQAVLQDSMVPDQQRLQAEQVIEAVNAVFPYPEVTNWTICLRFLSNAERCSQLIQTKQYHIFSKQSATLFDKVAVYFENHALYQKSEEYCRHALLIRERLLGKDHPDTAESLNNLAFLYTEQGLDEQAIPLHVEALRIRQLTLGMEHPDTAESLNNLAALYTKLGKYEEALPLYTNALSIRKRTLGEDHPDTAISLNNLGGFYLEQAMYEQALPLFEQALTICEKKLGEEHPKTTACLHNIAYVYTRQEKYEQALPLYRRALAINEKVLGPEHPATASSLNNLAGLYEVQEKYEQAEPFYKRALTIREKILGADHPDTIASLNNLAYHYYNQGKYEQAEPLFLRALTIDREQP